MRKDAKEHRRMLIAAADDVLAIEGYRAPLEAVLYKARVGRGTLYRNFKDRESIVVAVLENVLQKLTNFYIENRESPTLLRDFMAIRARMGVRHFAATTDLKDSGLAIAAVRERAELLYNRVLEDAKFNGQAVEGVDSRQISMINRMLILAVREAPDRDPAHVISDLLDIVTAGLYPR